MSNLAPAAHAWLPHASCNDQCVRIAVAQPLMVALRVMLRSALALLLALALPLLAVPLPGRTQLQRAYRRLMLRCFSVRIAVSAGPVRNLRGVLEVSGHVSWLDIFAIGAVLPGAFVARADIVTGRAVGIVARVMSVIPIERSSLRRLPDVVATVAGRLRARRTVVAFPEGTTWCARASGPFYPAMFQAAIDAGRPVQPLRLTYHHMDGKVSTTPAYVGQDTLYRSICRLFTAGPTVARVQVESLQLPGSDRRELARRCHTAVRAVAQQLPQRQPLPA